MHANTCYCYMLSKLELTKRVFFFIKGTKFLIIDYESSSNPFIAFLYISYRDIEIFFEYFVLLTIH